VPMVPMVNRVRHLCPPSSRTKGAAMEVTLINVLIVLAIIALVVWLIRAFR